MRWTSKLAAAAFAILLPLSAAARTPAPAPVAAKARAPVTILISIDGFRSDYLERGVTPNLSKLAAEGVTAPMHPSFPSKTFPNHWTLVTGLRPDRHGITANKMKDAGQPDVTFTMSNDDPFWWNAADPIWVDAENAHIRTSTSFWPGSNVAIGGHKEKPGDWEAIGGTRPSDWAQFNQSITGEQRVNGVLDWLRRPAAIRPRFVTLYFNTVDDAGHDFGPDDARTTEAVAKVDAQIGMLVQGLRQLGQRANLVIVADHGMAATSSERVIALDQMLALDTVDVLETGPYLSLTPVAGQEALVEKALLGKHPHAECWRKGEIPARFHYGTNPRIPPIFCLAETGWLFNKSVPTKSFSAGNHGWDNMAPEMTALFIASGPAFRAAKLPAFDNVDVYPLLRDLIGLPAKPGVDGTDAVFAKTMRR
ncbi:MAG: alkaline phosphatase family protein [Sphingomonas sp.]|uniref:nucleotide pyrophosphatase/phosphodiesterase family protein n=1 Tax=Sphingomonas sp. TaxID=28214 RepID=UPI0026001B2B|nr:nucleotide pyrophosphatase/phosphodiesterase family protein [Sphingomonas sp.]MBX3566208.1 alkaline phosphatase family protein [Sphingomonas sp.]